jgi:hypothetical protein
MAGAWTEVPAPHKRAEVGWWVMVEGRYAIDDGWYRVVEVDDSDDGHRLLVACPGTHRWVADRHITDARPDRPDRPDRLDRLDRVTVPVLPAEPLPSDPVDDRPAAFPTVDGGMVLVSEVVEVGGPYEPGVVNSDPRWTDVTTRAGARVVALPRSAVLDALGWRAVEVPRD